jgi:hypothetical protein
MFGIKTLFERKLSEVAQQKIITGNFATAIRYSKYDLKINKSYNLSVDTRHTYITDFLLELKEDNKSHLVTPARICLTTNPKRDLMAIKLKIPALFPKCKSVQYLQIHESVSIKTGISKKELFINDLLSQRKDFLQMFCYLLNVNQLKLRLTDNSIFIHSYTPMNKTELFQLCFIETLPTHEYMISEIIPYKIFLPWQGLIR